ncbi:hypothetical protein BJY01DRAFT_237543 [Aspergillus pseudoustus]|uniref:Ankyrin repeat-containing domain protein n=1 Tax=Aspergillus pseudoustus TaxID=1810923 RepID=A0ABR4JED9_9EURO
MNLNQLSLDPLVRERMLISARTMRQRQFEEILAARQERASSKARAREAGRSIRDPLVWQMGAVGCYEDLPLTNPNDLAFIQEPPCFLEIPYCLREFESNCRRGTPLAVQRIISSESPTPTPAFLHHGLCLALKAGNVEVSRSLLAIGAPIVRRTPDNILLAPVDRQIPLFELLSTHGWTPNTPAEYGAVLLPSVLANHAVLRWFLTHGANPNLGKQQEYRYGGPCTESCDALEKAAYQGDVEAARMLLDAGAVIQNGFPLHAAAAALPPGANPHVGLVTLSKDFDISRIPVMALLIERGADINLKQGPQRGNMVPGYAIVEAVMGGAVERVRLLLNHGADPTKRGPWGSAVDYATRMGSEEMRTHTGGLCSRDELPLPTSQSVSQRRRLFPRIVSFLGAISFLWLTLHWFPTVLPNFRLSPCHLHTQTNHDATSLDGDRGLPLNSILADSERVPFEAHIMSKCPDARDCIRELVVPTMERVGDKVDFELSFIASVSNKSSDVECMHGPTECIGDMLMLCAANLPFPPESNAGQVVALQTPPVRYLGFSNCLISNYEEIPDRTLVEQCALEYGIDFDALNECVSQQDDNPNQGSGGDRLSGVALLRKSARHSAELGVRTSCTVRVDDTVWCVRDGGAWKDCAQGGEGSQVSVLVDQIEKLWKQRN